MTLSKQSVTTEAKQQKRAFKLTQRDSENEKDFK